jgi:hypothetical protein
LCFTLEKGKQCAKRNIQFFLCQKFNPLTKLTGEVSGSLQFCQKAAKRQRKGSEKAAKRQRKGSEKAKSKKQKLEGVRQKGHP